MNTSSTGVAVIISTAMLGILILGGSMFLPSWGKLELQPARSVTVVGEARSDTKTQVALFSAGVNAYNDNKQAAVDEVNKKVAAIIDAVMTFGVSPDDIQTQSLSIYQNHESYYDESGHQKLRPGQWNVGSMVSIKLRNVDQASALAGVLSQSGATNVNGPQFTFDDTSGIADSLTADALKNASDKATKIAQSVGRQLGKVISVTEGYTPSQQIYPMVGLGGGGGGAPTQPGTGTVTKTMTVTYVLE